MRFRYSFQKIVDLKSSEKAQAEWYLSHAVNVLRDEESTLSDLYSEREHVRQDALKAAENRTTASELMMFQQYVNHLNHRISSKNEDIKKAQQHVETQQERLTGKMKEEKVWLNARERALDLFRHDMTKREQDQLDEMATNRYKPAR